MTTQTEDYWLPMWKCPLNTFVLLVRNSGYATTPFEVLTGRLVSIEGVRARLGNPSIHVRELIWVDVCNDRITDSGELPFAWKPFPEITYPKAEPFDETTGVRNAVGIS